MASCNPKGEVSASTGNGLIAPAEAFVERLTVRQLGRVSDGVNAGKPPTACAAQDQRWRDPPRDNPIAEPQKSPAPLPRQGPAADTIS